MRQFRADAELRKNWRRNWLSCIEEFANYDMQKATWLNLRNTNPHYGFVEYIECYFDDLTLNGPNRGYEALVREGLLTLAEAEAVSDFHATADKYEPPNNDDYDHATILADPKWLEVVASARSARERLSVILTNPDELKDLYEPSEHALAVARS